MNAPRTWNMWAHDYGKCFIHIGPKRYVELHGITSSPIVEIRLTEDTTGDYYGWLKTGQDTPTMIWPSEAQFSMCFAYGPNVEVERGEGQKLRFTVAKL